MGSLSLLLTFTEGVPISHFLPAEFSNKRSVLHRQSRDTNRNIFIFRLEFDNYAYMQWTFYVKKNMCVCTNHYCFPIIDNCMLYLQFFYIPIKPTNLRGKINSLAKKTECCDLDRQMLQVMLGFATMWPNFMKKLLCLGDHYDYTFKSGETNHFVVLAICPG